MLTPLCFADSLWVGLALDCDVRQFQYYSSYIFLPNFYPTKPGTRYIARTLVRKSEPPTNSRYTGGVTKKMVSSTKKKSIWRDRVCLRQGGPPVTKPLSGKKKVQLYSFRRPLFRLVLCPRRPRANLSLNTICYCSFLGGIAYTYKHAYVSCYDRGASTIVFSGGSSL